MAGDGQNVMISYSGHNLDGGYPLKVKPMPANFSSAGPAGRACSPSAEAMTASSPASTRSRE